MSARTTAAAWTLLGTLAIVLGARVAVGMVPVPTTLQTLAVVAVGLLGGARIGAAAALLYLSVVLLGLPVLAEGASAGGAAFLELKSAGYVVGFVPGAWVAGRLGEGRTWPGWIAAGLAGHAVILCGGWGVLSLFIGAGPALQHGVLPFVVGALVKSLAAAALMASWRWGRAARRRP